jgi:hypothetical protein
MIILEVIHFKTAVGFDLSNHYQVGGCNPRKCQTGITVTSSVEVIQEKRDSDITIMLYTMYAGYLR